MQNGDRRVTTVRMKDAERIDALMEKASRELVSGDYFAAERSCVAALDKAFIAADYARMARILLPLQEARRQKRDLAFDTGAVYLVTGEIPSGRQLKAGCYMVAPPRVGVDGRALREAADRKGVPVIVVVREPTTREGLWPIVMIGPVTIRTKVPAPTPASTSTRSKKVAEPAAPPASASFDAAAEPLPSPQWMLEANEALGDAALEQVPQSAAPEARVEAVLDRLRAHPDHEKLHQRLEEACRQAAQLAKPTPGYRRRQRDLEVPEETEGDESDPV